MQIMENKDFDKFIKQGLEDSSLTDAYSSDWNSMEEMLDMDEVVGDEDFDQYLKQGITHSSAAAYSSDWDTMEGMLDKDERERKELIYIKGIEFVLVVLTIITLFQFYPNSNAPSKNPFQSANTSMTIQESNLNTTTENHLALNNNATNDDIDESTEIDIFSKENNAITSIKDNSIKQSTNTATSIIPTTTYELPSQEMKNLFSGDRIENGSGFVTETPSTPIISNNSTNAQKTNIEVVIDEFSVIEESESIIGKENSEEEKTIRSSKLEPIETLNNSELSTPKPDVKMPVIVLKPQFRTSYHIGADRNHIFTPYNTDSKSSFQQANYGFSTGVKVSLQKGKWEFETGLSYNRKAYRPQPVFEITGSSLEGYEAETLKKLTFNTISIPLDIRFYTLDMSNKWNLYIVTGANFSTVAWSNYGRYTYEISNGSSPQGITAGRPLKSINNQKAGIFFGESLRDNFYMTASLGIGMEVDINKRTSFFTQPKFTYYLLPGNVGLGPNNDQFNTISIDLGLRFKM
jgi:hypothetical protein